MKIPPNCTKIDVQEIIVRYIFGKIVTHQVHLPTFTMVVTLTIKPISEKALLALAGVIE